MPFFGIFGKTKCFCHINLVSVYKQGVLTFSELVAHSKGSEVFRQIFLTHPSLKPSGCRQRDLHWVLRQWRTCFSGDLWFFFFFFFCSQWRLCFWRDERICFYSDSQIQHCHYLSFPYNLECIILHDFHLKSLVRKDFAESTEEQKNHYWPPNLTFVIDMKLGYACLANFEWWQPLGDNIKIIEKRLTGWQQFLFGLLEVSEGLEEQGPMVLSSLELKNLESYPYVRAELHWCVKIKTYDMLWYQGYLRHTIIILLVLLSLQLHLTSQTGLQRFHSLHSHMNCTKDQDLWPSATRSECYRLDQIGEQ